MRGEDVKSRKEVATATMKDVAQKAQVSTATVSRALMNPDKVSQATRNRVEQAALEVGYFPQAMGRNVKRNESRTILVIVPDICDPFFSEIIRGIEVTAAEQGYLVLIGDCAHQNQQEKTFIDLIITKQIDGMLLLGSRLPFDASIEEQRNLPPMVMANEFAPELELPTVHIDNLTAAFNAVNYLQELGHKRIGCIAGPEEMPLCHYRLQGYVQALRRTGATVDPHYIARGDFTFEAGGLALEKLLALPQPPTAVFCHSDVMALGHFLMPNAAVCACQKICRSSGSIIFLFQNFAIRHSQPSRNPATRLAAKRCSFCWISCMVKQLAVGHVCWIAN
jgi:LacI family repressor for deo operon, udp, cdd, tsx, nupC, and nupG